MLKLKKTIILLISILLITGCTANLEQEHYVDKDTCVVYLVRYRGGISLMYNSDGTLKLDKKCMKQKKGEI